MPFFSSCLWQVQLHGLAFSGIELRLPLSSIHLKAASAIGFTLDTQ